MRKIKTALLLSSFLFGTFSLFVALPSTPASGEVPWINQGPEWYYDNLNAIDRQKIRHAMDYCVPREQIINDLHFGFAEAIASPIGVNFVGVYEPTIAAREYDTWTAGLLLEDVFGYTYDTSLAETDEISNATAVPYFTITLLCPTGEFLKTRSAALIAYNFNRVGIATTVEWLDINRIMPRIFLNPVGIGYDHDNGGYDAFFCSIDSSPDPDFKDYYDKDSFPPFGNWYWIEDGPATSGTWATTGPGPSGAFPNITALWTDVYKEFSPVIQTQLLKEYQQWCYDNVPTCIIRQEIQVWALDTNLQGFDLFHGIKQQICNWTLGGATSCVIAQADNFIDFNPLMTNNYYDDIVSSNTFCSLSRRRGEYNLSHAVPWLAESWTHTPDYKNWTVQLRSGIQWSDGSPITADDVVFTYHSILNATTNSPNKQKLQNILGNNTNVTGRYSAVTKVNDYSVKFVLPNAYVFTETVLFGFPIVQKAQLEPIGLANWKIDGTNTGTIPLVSSGPYMMHQYDKFNAVELWVNPYYDGIDMGHNPTMTGGGNWIPDPTITNVTFEICKSGIKAVNDLLAGTYDVVDPHMGIQGSFMKVNDSIDTKILFSYEWGYQEMGLNQYSSILGMNPPNPRNMYPSEKIGGLPNGNKPKSNNSSPLSSMAILIAIIGLAGLNIVSRKGEK